MAAAVAFEAPRSGRDVLANETESGFLPVDINRNQPRYFVQMGWHSLSVDTPCIKGGILWRGEILPCRTTPVPEHHACIAETQKLPGSEKEDRDGKVAWAFYSKYAYNEAERLMLEESSADRKNGLVEIKSLYSDLGNKIFREINLNTLFLPTWPDLPAKNEDLLDILMDRIDWLAANPPPEIPQNQVSFVLPVLLDVGQELINATEHAQRVQTEEVIRTHLKMKLPRADEGHKDRYDTRDFEILMRTGIPRIDTADIQNANALQLLAQNSVNAKSGGVNIEAILEQNAQLMHQMAASQAQTNQLIALMLSQQGIKLPDQPAPEETKGKTPQIPKVKS